MTPIILHLVELKFLEDGAKLKAFVFDRLQSEISELHSDQKVMAENFQKLEEFVVEALQPNRREGSDSKRSSRTNGVSPSLLEL